MIYIKSLRELRSDSGEIMGYLLEAEDNQIKTLSKSEYEKEIADGNIKLSPNLLSISNIKSSETDEELITPKTVRNCFTYFTGNQLLKFISSISTLKHRYAFKDIKKYIENTNERYVLALYGLRRTGKTVLMFQTIAYLINEKHISPNNIAFITFKRNTQLTYDNLVDEIERFTQNYIFIDEISYLKGSIEDSSLNMLADEVCMQGKKIVIAGTFSYAIKIMSRDILLDRIQLLDTTYFSFKEAHEILGYTLEGFIQTGGIIKSSKSNFTAEEYLKTSVIDNITTYLIRSEELELKDRQKTGVLIRNLIDTYMKEILYTKVLKPNYKYSDIGTLMNKIQALNIDDSITTGIYNETSINKENLYKIVYSTFNTINKSDISPESFNKILSIFKELGIIADIKLMNTVESLFVSHYLRWNLCKEIVSSISEEVSKQTGNRYTADIAFDILKGNMLEAIIQLDLYKGKKHIISKYRNNTTGMEVDLIIENKGSIDLYEIKHSSKIVYEQAKNLVTDTLLNEIEAYYEKPISSLNILYTGENGETVEINPIEVYKSIVIKRQALGKPTKQWTELIKQANLENWQSKQVNYINITKFLLSKS